MMEMKLAVTLILSRYRVRPDPEKPALRLLPRLVLRSETGINVQLERI